MAGGRRSCGRGGKGGRVAVRAGVLAKGVWKSLMETRDKRRLTDTRDRKRKRKRRTETRDKKKRFTETSNKKRKSKETIKSTRKIIKTRKCMMRDKTNLRKSEERAEEG